MKCWLQGSGRCKELHCADKDHCMILYKLNYLYNEANVPFDKRKYKKLYTDIDGSDTQAFTYLKSIEDNVLDFVEKGNNLLIYSKQCGNGKTSWSLRILQSFLNKICLKTSLRCRALFIHVPSFLLALKDNITTKDEFVQRVKDNIEKCDLVIWDDIGSKSATVYECENLLSFIDRRIMANKTNIYTSNLNLDELHEALGDRLFSRICSCSSNVILRGGDKRYLNHDEGEK